MTQSIATPSLNSQVRSYWEAEPCGTGAAVVDQAERYSKDWFDRIEDNRYTLEPFIHQIAQFTRHRGKKVLEVGVGAGTDHLQFARAGAICHGVDLTQAAIETTRARLEIEGLSSELTRLDAESLPFSDHTFDIVYSWGVIHHSSDPAIIAKEVRRVLKPGGKFIGMVYNRRSILTFKLWVRHALMTGRPFRSFSDVVWNHMESIGTKAYTRRELKVLLGNFEATRIRPLLTPYDTTRWPSWITSFFPDRYGWFLAFVAQK